MARISVRLDPNWVKDLPNPTVSEPERTYFMRLAIESLIAGKRSDTLPLSSSDPEKDGPTEKAIRHGFMVCTDFLDEYFRMIESYRMPISKNDQETIRERQIAIRDRNEAIEKGMSDANRSCPGYMLMRDSSFLTSIANLRC